MPCQAVRQNKVWSGFGFRIPGLWEWASGFRWNLVNVLKQCPYIVLVSCISEFRQAEIYSRWKFRLDLESNIRQGWAEVVSRWGVRLDLESKADGVGTEAGGVSSEFGFWIYGDRFQVLG